MNVDKKLLDSVNEMMRFNDMLVRDSAMLGKEKWMVNEAQLSTAENLSKLLEQYEANLKEQAKESHFNRRLSVASFVIAVFSLLVAIFK